MKGKNKRAGIARVPFATASADILSYMRKHPRRLCAPSELAGAVWPGHTMRAQGAAFAIGPTLAKLQKAGKIGWACDRDAKGDALWWGWRLA